jgi:prepilin-type N-terminal cleavage/methylation domain-containing protein
MTRISLQTTPTSEHRDPGFSLIEMLVVVAIIALFSLIALRSIGSYTRVGLDTATRELAGTIKEAYNSTVITGKVHRLVYDLKNAQYWVEVGPASVVLETKETLEKEARRKRYRKDEEKPKSAFGLDKTVTRKKVSLPTGVAFEDVLTQQNPEPLTEGIAYTHFFPQGFTEQTLIHLANESKQQITLAISPMVGRTDMFGRYVTKQEAFGKE